MPNPASAKKAFASVLRENGFQGSAPTFRRFEGKDTVAVVNLQASRIQPGGTYVNLGVHRRGLEKPSSWDKIQAHECAFSDRLEDFAGGDLFFFDDEASMTALFEMMKLEGFPWLAQQAAKGAKKPAKRPAKKASAVTKSLAKKKAPPARKSLAKKKAPAATKSPAKKKAPAARKAPAAKG